MKNIYSSLLLLLSINLLAQHSLLNNSFFLENKGQIKGTDAQSVKFLLHDKNFTLFLMDKGISYQFIKKNYSENLYSAGKFSDFENSGKEILVETYRIDLEFIGANPNAKIISESASNEKVNYIDNKNISTSGFSKITYQNIYPKIDWVIYTKDAKVKYDFVVHPGGNPNMIKFKSHWADQIKLNEDGSFTMNCPMGSVTEKAPLTFQGGKVIASKYVLKKDIIQIKVAPYDETKTLIIDPALDWVTYYGGNGSGSVDEAAFSTCTDASGNVYIAGRTSSTVNIASGGHQNSFGAGYDAFLVKFNSNGVRIWSTYYGGANWDSGYSCTTDAQGNVYLAGATAGSASAIASGGHQNTHGGGSNDAYLAKFNSNGQRIWATYYGGNGDEFANHCIVDNTGNVYIAGATSSTTSIASNGHQNTYGGGTYDPFIVKFDNNGVRQWATYYGGNGGGVVDEIGYSIACDQNGNVYLAGRTNSQTGISSNGHQNSLGGGYDGFLVKFDALGQRQWATYYGGNNWESAYSCATDASGNIYLAGATAGSAGAIASGGHQNTHGGGTNDAYLVKFDSNGLRKWATYYGGSADDYATCAVTDVSGNIYIAGNAASSSGIASGGQQNTYGGGNYDAFLARFDSNGTRLDATYFGASGDDRGHSCDIDPVGNLYLCGQTSSTNLGLGGHQNNYGGGTFDGYLAKYNVTFLGIEAAQNPLDARLYPNPTSDFVTLELLLEAPADTEITLYNQLGQLLLTQNYYQLSEIKHQFDISMLPSNMYWVEIKTKKGKSLLPLLKK
jgi:hypothetical protein